VWYFYEVITEPGFTYIGGLSGMFLPSGSTCVTKWLLELQLLSPGHNAMKSIGYDIKKDGKCVSTRMASCQRPVQ
jgi:hypothetical protein